MNVPIRKLKAELSRYIREASAGKDVVVTSRGKALVRLVPVVEEHAQRF
jgi:prevent-host-death family protein